MDMPQEQAMWFLGTSEVRLGGTAVSHEPTRSAAFDDSAQPAELFWLSAPPGFLSRRLADYALHQMTPAEIADKEEQR